MDLFAAGVELDAAARPEFIARSCQGDGELREQLARLLQIEAERLGDFLREPVVATTPSLGAAGTTFEGVAPAPPSIDGYTDFEIVAQGGMGTVYRALQTHPVRRTVAIKAIRPGMDSGAVLARFEAERQALALMAHPNIATVHDAGIDALGRPFLAMEFVDGQPINVFCDAGQLTLDQRLDLFVQVCDAVEHAHRRGVLHRDLKPSNVLVRSDAGQPLPKVIDFGIAKAIEGSLGDRSIHTEQGSFLGTPEYMSPEQLDGDSARIDTRTDVYSLGVVLYELVTGELPFDAERLRVAGFARMATIVRDETPPKPSTRVRARLATARERQRDATTVRWLHRLQGDLDWIAMKALEKDPDRRYGSPRELAADIRAFRANLPTVAGPPSGVYRLRRFVRRHRIQVAAAALVLLSLVLGLCGTLWFLFESRRSETAADERARAALAALREADGHRLATEAAMLAETNPNIALLLAIEASERIDGPAIEETLLKILPHHDLVGLFDQFDHTVHQALHVADGGLLLRGFQPAVLLVDDQGTLLRRFAGHGDGVHDMALSPSGRLLLTVSADATARLWDVATGACEQVAREHGGEVVAGVFAPDGARFATACLDHFVRIFDVATGSLLQQLDAGGPCRAIAFAPDGTRLAAQPEAGPTVVFDLGTGTVDLRLPLAAPGRSVVPRLRFTPRGDRLVRDFEPLYDDSRLAVFTAEGERLGEFAGMWLLDAPLDDPLLVGTLGGYARVSLATGALLERHPVPGLSALLEPSPDGAHAIGVDDREDLCIVDLRSDRIVRRLSGRSDKTRTGLDVAFHPDGGRFVVTGSSVRTWAWTPEFAPFEVPARHGAVRVVSLVADGEPLVLLEHYGTGVRDWSLWNIGARTPLQTLRPEGITQLWLASTGTRLLGIGEPTAAPGGERRARVATFDLAGRLLHEVQCDPGVGILPRPDGLQFAVGQDERPGQRTLRIFDAGSGAVVGSFPVAPVVTAWSGGPAFAHLLQGWGSRSRTDVFDAGSGATIASVRGPMGAGHYGMSVDAATNRLLVVLGDLRARVFDLGGDRLHGDAAPLAEYSDLVRSDAYDCGFAAGGRLGWVMCANEVHLFEAATGARFAVLRLRARAARVAAAANGRELFTVTVDGCCQRWPLDPLPVARRLVRGELSARQLAHYRIGTPEERDARTRQAQRARPTPRNWARLGEAALRDGDLDEAIVCFQRGSDLGPLAPADARIYVRLLELRCRRLARDRTAPSRGTDIDAALAALAEAVRCGVSAESVRGLPDIDELAESPRFRQLLRE